jgi:hypothetical protein
MIPTHLCIKPDLEKSEVRVALMLRYFLPARSTEGIGGHEMLAPTSLLEVFTFVDHIADGGLLPRTQTIAEEISF